MSGRSGTSLARCADVIVSAGIIRAMVDRGLPIVDGAPACPFVAFEDDRDERATAPDHRHRCYAEPRPAPRALAHQDAYCLSANFPICPTFQDWARREAAAARPASPAHAEPTSEAEPPPERHPLPPPDREARHAPDDSLPPRRNPPRDWAAPPPWTGGAGPAGGRGPDDTPPFLSRRDETPPEARGLAGSAADRMAGGGSVVGDRGRDWAFDDPDEPSGPDQPVEPPRRPEPSRTPEVPRRAEPDRELRWTERDTIGRRRPDSADPDAADDDDDAAYASPRPARPPARGYVDRTRDRGGRVDATRRGRGEDEGPELFGPAWERPRRYEAYPTLRSRVSLPVPRMSRVLVALAALGIGVVVFFALPGLLGVGSDDTTPRASLTSSPSPTIPPSPTPTPEPTPQTYVVASGDTLSRIAKRFDLTVDQILAVNPQIKDADEIAIGDEIIIPVPGESDDGTETEPPPSSS
jgi:hypothetical protein